MITLNIHVTSSFCVHLSFDLRDRLWDLKLAILETQLQEIYPDVVVESHCDSTNLLGHVHIYFNSLEDLVHWQLKQSYATNVSFNMWNS